MVKHDIDKFLVKFHQTAVLDNPSVGSSFVGHDDIRKYFEDYFIGDEAQTTIYIQSRQYPGCKGELLNNVVR